jgi:hypothetical protein
MSEYAPEGQDGGFEGADVDAGYQPPSQEEYAGLQQQLDEQAAYNQWLQEQIPAQQPEPPMYGYQPQYYEPPPPYYEPPYDAYAQVPDQYYEQPYEQPYEDPYADRFAELEQRLETADMASGLYLNALGEATFNNLVQGYEQQFGALGGPDPASKQAAYQQVGALAEQLLDQGYQADQAIYVAVQQQRAYEDALRARGVEANNQQLTNAANAGMGPGAGAAAAQGRTVRSGQEGGYEDVVNAYISSLQPQGVNQ